MQRVYFVQQWLALSDPAMEDEQHESESMRRFAGLSLIDDAIPSDTAIQRFHHLLEKHKLTEAIGAEVQQLLKLRGLILRTGTIADATIINAPSSTKNTDGQHDPAMTRIKKSHQWYFGMKVHIRVDAKSSLVHTVVTGTASVNDKCRFDDLLHGEETAVWANRGYDCPDIRRRCAEREQFLGIVSCARNRANHAGKWIARSAI